LVGLDPSEKAVLALQKQGMECYVGNVFDTVPKKLLGVFDVIICTSVIEHIYDLNMFIEQCKKYLRPQGVLFIEAPSVEGFSKYFLSIPNYFNHEHINYFSQISLDNLFLNHGCKRLSTNMESRITLKQKSWIEEELVVIYRKENTSFSLIEKDNVSKKSIIQYFDTKKLILSFKEKQICSFLRTYEYIVIWGTGALTSQLLRIHPSIIDKVVFFVDNNRMKQGLILAGKKIYSPKYLLQCNNNPLIIIASMMNSEDIIHQIQDMKLLNKYYIL
jgi:SAM-dependent methyltransferase